MTQVLFPAINYKKHGPMTSFVFRFASCTDTKQLGLERICKYYVVVVFSLTEVTL